MQQTILEPVYAAAIRHTEDLMKHWDATNPVPLADMIVTFEKLIDQLKHLQFHLDNADALIVLVRCSRVAFVHGEAGDRAGAYYDLTHRVLKRLVVACGDAGGCPARRLLWSVNNRPPSVQLPPVRKRAIGQPISGSLITVVSEPFLLNRRMGQKEVGLYAIN